MPPGIGYSALGFRPTKDPGFGSAIARVLAQRYRIRNAADAASAGPDALSFVARILADPEYRRQTTRFIAPRP